MGQQSKVVGSGGGGRCTSPRTRACSTVRGRPRTRAFGTGHQSLRHGARRAAGNGLRTAVGGAAAGWGRGRQGKRRGIRRIGGRAAIVGKREFA